MPISLVVASNEATETPTGSPASGQLQDRFSGDDWLNIPLPPGKPKSRMVNSRLGRVCVTENWPTSGPPNPASVQTPPA